MLEAFDVLKEHLAVSQFRFESREILKGNVLLFDKLSDDIGMDELAPVAVRALSVFMELLTEFSFVPGWHMFLFLEFCLTVSKCTGIPIGALSVFHKRFTELGLNLNLVILAQDSSIALEGKWIVAFLGLPRPKMVVVFQKFGLIPDLVFDTSHEVVKIFF